MQARQEWREHRDSGDSTAWLRAPASGSSTQLPGFLASEFPPPRFSDLLRRNAKTSSTVFHYLRVLPPSSSASSIPPRHFFGFHCFLPKVRFGGGFESLQVGTPATTAARKFRSAPHRCRRRSRALVPYNSRPEAWQRLRRRDSPNPARRRPPK